MKVIIDIICLTGITATAGIGTNMYLAKVAMDIVAKHISPDENGVRIAELDEMSYREKLWEHRPLTDFWRVGKGYASKLEHYGLYTMGDIARCSLTDEDWLFRLFGVNAELLIDHAWGWEPCTMVDIKGYKPENNSLGAGQVLHEPYTYSKAKIIVREMIESLTLDLVDKGLVTDQIVLTVGYDRESLADESIRAKYTGEIKKDHYGRNVPKHAHGTGNLKNYTSSLKALTDCCMELYERIVNKDLLIRRVNIVAGHVISETDNRIKNFGEQLDFFTDFSLKTKEQEQEEIQQQKEKNLQKTILNLKKKYGKNAVLKGINFTDGATMRDRNQQVGGHKA